MKKRRLYTERFKFFLLGVLSIIGICLLMGADYGAPGYGRYQISAWGASFGDFSGGCGAFVVDTVTGETKTVYRFVYGSSDGTSVLKTNLGKPFSAIK